MPQAFFLRQFGLYRPITRMKKSTTRGLIAALIVLAIIVLGAVTVSQCNEVADEPGPAATQ